MEIPKSQRPFFSGGFFCAGIDDRAKARAAVASACHALLPFVGRPCTSGVGRECEYGSLGTNGHFAAPKT